MGLVLFPLLSMGNLPLSYKGVESDLKKIVLKYDTVINASKTYKSEVSMAVRIQG